MYQLGMSNEELMKFLTQETNKPEFTNKLTDYYTKVKSAIPDKALAVLPVCTLLAATLASKAIAENNKIISQQLANSDFFKHYVSATNETRNSLQKSSSYWQQPLWKLLVLQLKPKKP